jgi:hypothetical protein
VDVGLSSAEDSLVITSFRMATIDLRLANTSLVSIVDDDRFFRESMRRLMRSLAYTAEAFASAAEFLASPASPKRTA